MSRSATPLDPLLAGMGKLTRRVNVSAVTMRQECRHHAGEAKHNALAQVQRQLTKAGVWVPLVREQLWVASGRRAHGVRAHGIYGTGIYEGLDITLSQ